MQTGQRIWKDDPACRGTGKQYEHHGSIQSQPRGDGQDSEINCPECDGLGIKPWGWLRDEKETIMPGEEA